MAKIDRKAFHNATTTPVKIGNNRTVRLTADHTMIFALHGHDIVTFGKGTLTLDPKGYFTVTTRRAMQDFVALVCHYPFAVSFAGGNFTAKMGGDTYTPDAKGKIVINID